MSKHHHQSKAEQINNKTHAAAPFHFEKTPDRANEPPAAAEDASIQIRAYQLHLEKGGSDLDNWLEAEKILRDDGHALNSLSTSNRRGSGGGG